MKELEEKEKNQDSFGVFENENGSNSSKNIYKNKKAKRLEKKQSKFYKFKDEEEITQNDVISNWAQEGSFKSPNTQKQSQTDFFNFDIDKGKVNKNVVKSKSRRRKNQSSIFTNLRNKRKINFDPFQTSNENKVENKKIKNQEVQIKNFSMVNLKKKISPRNKTNYFADVFKNPFHRPNKTRHSKVKSSNNHQNTFDLLALDISSDMQAKPNTIDNKYNFLDDLNRNFKESEKKSFNGNGDQVQFI